MTMHSKISTLCALAAISATAAAQSDYVGPANLLFTMDNTVALNTLNTNEATIIGDEGLLSFSPGSQTFALPLCDYGTWAAFLGDVDGDALYDDSIITSIDAVWAPRGTPTPPSMFDVFISVQTPIPAGGYLGVAVSDGDIFRLTTTGVETYLSQADVLIAMGSPSAAPDINGFAVDQTNNDLYMTFTATMSVNGTSMLDGGIMRIPGSALTLTGGLVTAVAPGSAEIVLTEADVDAMFVNAGLNGVTDLTGIEIDPTGGTFVGPTTALTIPHLWLCDDDNADEAFVSTHSNPINLLQGVIPSVNGIVLQGGPALGLAALDPFGGAVDNPFGIAFQASNPTGPTPMTVDAFPVGPTTSTAASTVLNIDLSGGTPGGFVFYVGELFDGALAGGFAARSGVAPIPVPSPSWREFYPSIPSSGISALALCDAEGFASFSLTVGTLPAGIGVKWQAADLTTFTLSAPTIIVTE